MNNQDEILKFLEHSKSPVTAHQVSEAVGISAATCMRILSELEAEGKVYSSTSEQRIPNGMKRKVLFFVARSNDAAVDKFKKLELDFSSREYEKICELEAKIEELERKERQFYSEIISIMGIFVAVFSLIVVNVDIIQNSFAGMICNRALLIRLGIIEGSTILAVAVLLLLIKLLFNNHSKKK